MIVRARFLNTMVETDVEIPDDVQLVKKLPWWMRKKFFAITLGTRRRPRIHVRHDPPDPRTLWHELQHVRQLRERGALRYYVGWVWDTILFAYSGNRLELEADRVADDAFKAYVKAHGYPR